MTVKQVIEQFWRDWAQSERDEGCQHHIVYHPNVGQYCDKCGKDAAALQGTIPFGLYQHYQLKMGNELGGWQP